METYDVLYGNSSYKHCRSTSCFVSEFAKQYCPSAWRTSAMKIQATFYVLGNDEEVVKELWKGSVAALVDVVLEVRKP